MTLRFVSGINTDLGPQQDNIRHLKPIFESYIETLCLVGCIIWVLLVKTELLGFSLTSKIFYTY